MQRYEIEIVKAQHSRDDQDHQQADTPRALRRIRRGQLRLGARLARRLSVSLALASAAAAAAARARAFLLLPDFVEAVFANLSNLLEATEELVVDSHHESFQWSNYSVVNSMLTH